MNTITPAERRSLKARAHALNPVVMISGNGLTDAVLAEIDRCLKAHELIKIRVSGEERMQRDTLLAQICDRCGATAVQHIGKILVIHRENPEPVAEKAVRRPAKRANPAKRESAKSTSRRAIPASATKRTSAPRSAATRQHRSRPVPKGRTTTGRQR